MVVPKEGQEVVRDGNLSVWAGADGRFYSIGHDGTCSMSGPTLESAVQSMRRHREYWNAKRDAKDNPASLRVGGIQYWIGGEDEQGMRGFDGALYVIRWNDGREQRSTNLWYNGAIPDDYRSDLPDNAVFVR